MAILSLALPGSCAQQAEIRAFWADAWHSGYQTPQEVTNLLSDLRAAHCNTVFLQVRKRGDALYLHSPYEPFALPIANFDPLAEVIRLAHDTNLGPRMEVHAWFNVYPVAARARNPLTGKIEDFQTDPNHPYNLHRDWLSKTENDIKLDNKVYYFDPGHPKVQDYLFKVAMDIISRYDLDGFQLDHLRYPSSFWGYNQVSIDRFNNLFQRKGKPLYSDPEWSQFRRDQVTDLLRKIYLSAIDLKPALKISVSTSTWSPPPKSASQWTKGIAHSAFFQDWPEWMEEGILDLNVLMDFNDEAQNWRAYNYSEWIHFAAENSFHRQAVIGQAAWLNSVSESLKQIRRATDATTGSNAIAGVAIYAYSGEPVDATTRMELNKALAHRNQYETNAIPVFDTLVPTPELPWKANPTKGYLKGFVWGGQTNNPLDGAELYLTGTERKHLRADGTGFYGAADLTPGKYSVVATCPGYKAETNDVAISSGKVTSQEFVLNPKQ